MTRRAPLCGTDRKAISELRSKRRVKGNCDGLFNGSDIGPFYLALGDPEEYENQYPICNILNP